jgi:hypothetical protein
VNLNDWVKTAVAYFIILSRHSPESNEQNNENFARISNYGSETWSLTLMEEHRLKVMQNRVLGRIFGVNRQKAGGDEKD